MSLPASVAQTEIARLSGGEVKVRGLTIVEVRRVRALVDATDADVLAISLAAGIGEDEAREWFNQALAGDLAEMIRAIFTATGLDEGATFPGPAGNDARPVGAGD